MKIAFFGDIGLFGKFDKQSFDYESYFEDIKKITYDCDYLIGNLEAPITDNTNEKGHKSAYIRSSIDTAKILKYIGFTHLNLANNHMLDYGYSGLHHTTKICSDLSIETYGYDNKSCYISSSGTEIKLSGYVSCDSSPIFKDRGHYLNEFNADNIKSKISKDILNILSVHFGIEHVPVPDPAYINFFRNLSKKHNFILHGHHPHEVQGNEMVNNSLINYSHGNFIFDDVYRHNKLLIKQTEENKKGLVVVVEIADNKIKNHQNFFTYLGKNRLNLISDIDRHQYRLNCLKMNSEEIKEIRRSRRESFSINQKKKRDINWYLNRINLYYAFLFVNNKINHNKSKKLLEDIDNDIYS